MTSEYGVTYFTAKKRFDNLIKDLSKEYEAYKKLLENDAFFKKIYTYLQTGAIAKLFFKITPAEWVEQQKAHALEFKISDLSYNYHYYKTKTHSIYYDLKFVEKRSRRVLTLEIDIEDWETAEIDTKKTNAAMYVNAVHAYDALYLRNIIRLAAVDNVALATIHDGFAIDLQSVGWLLGAANYAFWDAEVDVYSNTIVL